MIFSHRKLHFMKNINTIISLIFFATADLSAQTRTVSGMVKTKDGQALAGVTVAAKGHSMGTNTNAEGHYELEIPQTVATLVFSYLGYETQEISIRNRQQIDVLLAETPGYLKEVVVTGFGSQSKRRLTSSIVSAGEEVFKNVPVTDFQNALQGRLPGVDLTNTSGMLNSEPIIRIRGIGSISAGNQPIVVIDGLILADRAKPYYYDYGGFATNPFINLNPNDIKSVEVLKDAAASAIYGSRGSNGVILITTKNGAYNAQPKINIGYWAGFSEASNKLRLLNGPEYAKSWNQAVLNAVDVDSSLLLPDSQPSTDWVGLGLRKGFKQEAYASVAGGTKTTKYYVAATAHDENSFLLNNDLQRYAVRVNLDQLIGEKFTLGLSVAPSRVKTTRPDDYSSPFFWAAIEPPNTEAFDASGKLIAGTPYATLTETWTDFTTNQLLLNTSLSYWLLPGLNLKTSLGVETTQGQELFNWSSKTYYGYPSGFASSYNNEAFNYNWTTLANWKRTIAKKHDIDLTAGFHLSKETLRGVLLEGVGFSDDRLKYVGSASQFYSFSSQYTAAGFTGFLARLNYAYANKYLLSLSGRYDGSSRFGVLKRFGFFPAVSAGWVITDESFFNPGFVNFLKLRSSFGISGNAEINDFASKGLVRFGQNYDGQPGYDVLSLDNDELGWEKNLQWDAGLDFSVWKNRIRGSLGYYIKDTRDLLLSAPVPATTGFTVITQNVGEVRNQGFEFDLSADILTRNLKWTIQLNGATLKNEVRKLIDSNGDGLDDDIYTQFRFLFRPGEAIGTFFMAEFAGVDLENGDALFWNAEGTEKLPNDVSDANRRIVGHSIPAFTGGISNTFRYKGFDLNTFLQFKTGYQIYILDGTTLLFGISGDGNAIKKYADDVWTPTNTDTNVPENRLGEQNGNQRSSAKIFDGDYLRVKNVSLGYTFQNLGRRNYQLRIFMAAQNLFLLTNYPGLDPDSSTYPAKQAEQGATISLPPSSRSYTMGFNLDF